MSDSPSLPPEDALLQHRAFLRGLARTLVMDGSQADDVVQEAYRVALERAPAHAPEPRAWLSGVVKNIASVWRRSEGRRARHERAAPRKRSADSASDHVARLEIQRLVVEAVMQLAEPYRETIVLRFFDELPPREIALRRGVPVNTVRTHLQRGLEQLRVRLDQQHSGDRRTWALALAPLGVPAATKGIAVATGVVVMSNKVKVSILLLLALGIGIGVSVWHGRTGSDTDGSPKRTTAAGRFANGPRPDAAGEESKSPAPDPKTPAAASAPGLRGRVVGPGGPVAGAWIRCEYGTRSEVETTTDATGHFFFPDLSGACTLTISHVHHAPLRKRGKVPTDGRVITLTLVAEQTLDLLVLDPNGQPLADARVFVVAATPRAGKRGGNKAFEKALEAELKQRRVALLAALDLSITASFDNALLRQPPVQTDGSGHARLRGLPDGMVTVVVHHPLYPAVRARGAPGAEAMTVRLKEPARLVVLSTRHNEWCEVLQPTLMGFPVGMGRTDASGRTEISMLPAGRYQIALSKHGTSYLLASNERESGPPSETATVELRAGQTTTLDRRVKIVGAVVEGTVAGVAEGTLIVLTDSNGERDVAQQRVGADLAFRFENVPAGSYSVSAVPDQKKPFSESIEVAPEQERVQVNLVMATGVVSGRLVDGDARPVKHAWVVLEPDRWADSRRAPSLTVFMDRLWSQARTDDDGRFSITQVRGGRYQVYVGSKRRLLTSRLELGDGERRELNLELAPRALHAIRVRFQGPDGAPVRVLAELLGPGAGLGISNALSSDPEPMDTLQLEVSPGRYRLAVSAPGLASWRAYPLEVTRAEEFVVSLVPGLSVVLSCDQAPNQPVAVRDEEGFRVGLGGTPFEIMMAGGDLRTDGEGRVTVNHLAPGTYTVEVAGRKKVKIKVSAEAREFEIR